MGNRLKSTVALLIHFLLVITLMMSGCDNSSISLSPESETYVANSIDTNTIWDVEHSPYIVTEDVTVEHGIVLTIHPGVEVRFNGFYGITVQGILIADGMMDCQSETYKVDTNGQNFEDGSSSIITFTCQPGVEEWKGIKLDNVIGMSVFRHVKIENAEIAIDCLASSMRLEDSFILNNNIGISIADSFVIVKHNLITNNVCGMLTKLRIITNSQVTKNSIIRNDTGIISYSASKSLILEQNNFMGNLGYVIIAKLYKKVVDARGNWWGTVTSSEIEKQIYDKNDDTMSGHVWYVPFASGEIADAYPRFCIEQ